MLNFDEEILRFKPILELEGIEHSIQSSDLSDLTDILVDTLRKNGKAGSQSMRSKP